MVNLRTAKKNAYLCHRLWNINKLTNSMMLRSTSPLLAFQPLDCFHSCLSSETKNIARNLYNSFDG
jgi:hypothetical protein